MIVYTLVVLQCLYNIPLKKKISHFFINNLKITFIFSKLLTIFLNNDDGVCFNYCTNVILSLIIVNNVY